MFKSIYDIPNSTIKNNVIKIGDVYFLAQDNSGQEQIAHYFGIKKIPQNSLTNFKKNHLRNQHFAKKHNFKHLHLICESKVSAHKKTIKEHTGIDIVDLASEFIIDDNVIYEKYDSSFYFNGDSHNNNICALHQAISCANKFLNSSDLISIKEFNYSTTTNKKKGDLGSKIDIEFDEVAIDLINGNKLPHVTFRLSTWLKGNSGNILHIYNPKGRLKGRLLIFGDSFIGIHLDIWSFVFQEIIHIRNPFILEDIILSLNPDFVITSNTERYLINAPSATNSLPFFINFLQEVNIDKDSLKVVTSLFSLHRNDFLSLITHDIKKIPLEDITIDDVKFEKDINYLREQAVKHEESDINLSYKLMSMAVKKRPNGPFLNKRLNYYKKNISSKSLL